MLSCSFIVRVVQVWVSNGVGNMLRHCWSIGNSGDAWHVRHSYHILRDSLGLLIALYLHVRQVRVSTHLTSRVEVHLGSCSSYTVLRSEVNLSPSGLWRHLSIKVLMVLEVRAHPHLSHVTNSVAFCHHIINRLLVLNFGNILHVLHHHHLPQNKILIIPFWHILLFLLIIVRIIYLVLLLYVDKLIMDVVGFSLDGLVSWEVPLILLIVILFIH